MEGWRREGERKGGRAREREEHVQSSANGGYMYQTACPRNRACPT